MKTLQAGDKAVLDGKEIVKCIEDYGHSMQIVGINWTECAVKSRLQPVYIVRVLQDGRAKQLNPLGDEPKEYIGASGAGPFSRPGYMKNSEWIKWHTAESQCLTLPWTMQVGITQKSHSDDLDKPWYALLSSDKFTLIKPITTT